MRRLKRTGWYLVVVVLTVLGLRTFVGDVYRISSPSMEPTLRAGDWVLVRFGNDQPRRSEVVVLRRRDELIVKRCLGVGNESVRLHSGDVWVNSAPLPPTTPRGRAVVLYDQALTPLEEKFDRGSTSQDPWSEVESGLWELDAREIPLGNQAGLLRYRPEVRDGWPELESQGTRMSERRDVGDILLEGSMRLFERQGRVRVLLIEQGDRFSFTFQLDGEAGGTYQISRRQAEGLRVLAEGEIELPRDDWFRFAFANVDDHLMARVGDVWLPVVAMGVNSIHPSDHARLGRSFGNRVMLGGEGCRLQVRDLRISRDLHYGPGGEFAQQEEVSLGIGELFLLGDNSPASRDSRVYGALPQRDMVGRAVAVVWPPSRWRWLRPEPWMPTEAAP